MISCGVPRPVFVTKVQGGPYPSDKNFALKYYNALTWSDSLGLSHMPRVIEANINYVFTGFVGGAGVSCTTTAGVNQWTNTTPGITYCYDIATDNFAGGAVYVCGNGGIMRVSSGGVDWSDLATITNVRAIDCYGNRIACVSLSGGNVAMFSNTGAVQWTAVIAGTPGGSSICIDKYNNVYVGCTTGDIVKYNSTGVHQWTVTFSAVAIDYIRPISSGTGIHPDIVVGAHTTVARLDKSTGATVWTKTSITGSLTGLDVGGHYSEENEEYPYIFYGTTTGLVYQVTQDAGVTAYSFDVKSLVGTTHYSTAFYVDQTATNHIALYIGHFETPNYYVSQCAFGVQFKKELNPPGTNFNDVTYQDGYFIATDTTNKFYLSDLEDPFTWDESMYEDADYKGGSVKGCASLRRNLFIFKEHSYEIYYNSGDSDFAFMRQSGGTYDKGLFSTRSLVEADGTLYWMATDFTIRRLNGYMPEKISTPLIETILKDFIYDTQIKGLSYVVDGQTFVVFVNEYYLGAGLAIQFNTATGLWNTMTGGADDDHFPIACCTEFNRTGSIYPPVFICGGRTVTAQATQHIFKIDPDSYSASWNTADPVEVYREKQAQIISADRERMFFRQLEIWAKTGTHSTTDETLYVTWSDDMGRTWSTARELNLGADGECLRLRALMLGSSFNRIFKVYSEHDAEMTLIGGFLR